ncbi:MAG: hypothetical protein E7395_00205 [Ruminococcaceae bacterium]|nr:hypothetical protein [Oscillospiraceae bacterium]
MKRNKLITLSFLMAVVMIMSVFVATVSVCAADTTVATATETYYVRNDETGANTIFVVDGYSNNHRLGFMKFDFSTINLDDYPGLKLKLTSVKGNHGNGNNVNKNIDIKISIIPQYLESSASLSTLTYSGANNAQWLNDFDSIGSVTGTIVDDTVNNVFYSTDILSAIKADIANNQDDTVVLKIESNITTNGYASVYYANWATGDGRNVQIVTMTEAEVNENKARAQADADALEIADTAELGSTIALPSEGSVNASKITWKSDSDYINTETGVVASSIGFVDEVVTLTATVNYNGIVTTKDFEVTLAGSNILPASDCVTIRGEKAEDNKSTLASYLVINQQTSDNRSQGVIRFDLTDVKKSIESLEDISVRLTMCYVKPGTNETIDYENGKYFLSILPDNAWTKDTMTLKYAIENNLISGATKAGTTGTVATVVGNTIVFSGLKDDIKAFIDSNPTATSISFLLNTEETRSEDSVYFYVMGNGEHKATEATQPLLVGETSKRFVAVNDNGAVTFTYNADSAKYPTGINMATTFFVAEYAPDGSLVNVVSGTDADSVITNGETKTLTITGYTSGNTIKAMVFNNSSEIMAMQPVTIFGN